MSRVVGIVGMGDMGSAVGRVLKLAGLRVVTALDGRSAASAALASAAGAENLGSLERVLAVSEIFLSILPPAAASALASDVVAAGRAGRPGCVYADCNAVAPATVREIAGRFAGSPFRFADVGIVGPPPRTGRDLPTRFYVSGPAREVLLEIGVPEIRAVDMGEEIGRASAIKICYAAMNKGVDALYANLLLAARQLDVEDELLSEFATSQSEALLRMRRRIPFLAATAARYVGEMNEIASGLDAAGVSGDFHRGAAWLYGLLARSDLAAETRASLPEERSLDEALSAFAAALDR